MKRKYLSGLAFTIAVAGGSSYVGAQGYPLYQGGNFAPSSYGPGPAWGTPQQPFHLTGYQGDQLIPQAVPHEHVPLPPTQHQPIAPQYSNQAVPYSNPIHQSAPQAPQPMASGIAPIPMAQPMPSGPVGTGCASCNGGVGSGAGYEVGGGYGGGGYVVGDAGASCGTYGGSYVAGPAVGLGVPWRMNAGAPLWFGGAGALFLNSQDQRYVRLSIDTAMPTDSALSTQDARIGSAAGVQAFFGRYINCGRNAIVGSYWGISPESDMERAMPGVGGNLRSVVPFGPIGTVPRLDMPTQTVYEFYDGAADHRIFREHEVHNVDVNLLGFGLGGAAVAPSFGGGGGGGWGSYGGCGPGACGPSYCGPAACGPSCGPAPCGYMGGPGGGLIPASCSRLRMGWLAGVRWLRFKDRMEYAASQTDNIYGVTDDDFYYTNRVVNDLVGFQFGGCLSYAATQRINLYGGSKFGIMNNHMSFDTRAGTTARAATINSGTAHNGMPYDLMASRDDIALLCEGDLGLTARICRGWSANVGYRAVGVSGVATSVGQIPYKFDDVDDIRRINNSDSLILHGVYFGGMYNF